MGQNNKIGTATPYGLWIRRLDICIYVYLFISFNVRKTIYFQFFVLSLHFHNSFLSYDYIIWFWPVQRPKQFSCRPFILRFFLRCFLRSFIFFLRRFGLSPIVNTDTKTHTHNSNTRLTGNRKLNEGKTFALVRTFLLNFVPLSSLSPQPQQRHKVGVGRFRGG